jgi:hypothetical protein
VLRSNSSSPTRILCQVGDLQLRYEFQHPLANPAHLILWREGRPRREAGLCGQRDQRKTVCGCQANRAGRRKAVGAEARRSRKVEGVPGRVYRSAVVSDCRRPARQCQVGSPRSGWLAGTISERRTSKAFLQPRMGIRGLLFAPAVRGPDLCSSARFAKPHRAAQRQRCLWALSFPSQTSAVFFQRSGP